MKMTTDFALLIRDFMTRYLVATRNVSQNTVLSYRDSYVLLLHCLNECYGRSICFRLSRSCLFRRRKRYRQ